MLKMFNFKWDRRTLRNILMLPLIITRIPITLFFWGIEYIHGWADWFNDNWPAWNQR